jgi:hypothetical protein
MGQRSQWPAGFLTHRRVVEWCVAAMLLTVLVVLFMKYMREVQAQGEYAAVRTTLGTLRTSLVIDYLKRHANPATGASDGKAPGSPFELLARRPTNYAGIVIDRNVQNVPVGSWVFDPVCPCVGYRPLNDGWLDSPSGEPMAWYRLSGAPGPLQLTAREQYRWQNQILD